MDMLLELWGRRTALSALLLLTGPEPGHAHPPAKFSHTSDPTTQCLVFLCLASQGHHACLSSKAVHLLFSSFVSAISIILGQWQSKNIKWKTPGINDCEISIACRSKELYLNSPSASFTASSQHHRRGKFSAHCPECVPAYSMTDVFYHLLFNE